MSTNGRTAAATASDSRNSAAAPRNRHSSAATISVASEMAAAMAIRFIISRWRSARMPVEIDGDPLERVLEPFGGRRSAPPALGAGALAQVADQLAHVVAHDAQVVAPGGRLAALGLDVEQRSG